MPVADNWWHTRPLIQEARKNLSLVVRGTRLGRPQKKNKIGEKC